MIERGTRRIRVLGATENPVQPWVVQQARNLLMDVEDAGMSVKFVLHDRDASFTVAFDVVLQAAGARVVRCAVLLRDLEDAAECYPDAIWPGQIARGLRALIHAANVARDKGLAAVPGEMTAEHLKLFRTASPSACRRSAASPAARTSNSPPPCTCWNASSTAKPTCCVS